MQHDHIQEKKLFLPFDPTQRVQGVFKTQNMFLHGALRSISFNLICKMTTFRKKSFDHKTLPQGPDGVCKDRICACMVLYIPFPLI